MFQVTTNSRFLISVPKEMANMPAGSANMPMPSTMIKPPNNLPATEIGVTSP